MIANQLELWPARLLEVADLKVNSQVDLSIEAERIWRLTGVTTVSFISPVE